MLVFPKLDIYSFVAEVKENEINLSATVMHNKQYETIETKPLLECKAGGIVIDQNFAQKQGIRMTKLEKPITA